MRTSASVIALLVAGVAATEFLPQTLKLDTPSIDFANNLNCGACVRGGYQFCKYLDPAAEVKQDCQKSKDPLFKDKDYVCSGTVVDQFNAVNNFCYDPQVQGKRPAECGDYNVIVASNDKLYTAGITKLAVGQSCVYRARTQCGFVRANLTFGAAIKQDQYDFAYGYSELEAGKDLSIATAEDSARQYFPEDWTKSVNNAENSDYLQVAPEKNTTSSQTFAGCNGTNTNLYVIVTKIKEDAKPAPTLIETEARSLQTDTPDVIITFSAWEGKNARILTVISVAFVAFLSVFAF